MYFDNAEKQFQEVAASLNPQENSVEYNLYWGLTNMAKALSRLGKEMERIRLQLSS